MVRIIQSTKDDAREKPSHPYLKIKITQQFKPRIRPIKPFDSTKFQQYAWKLTHSSPDSPTTSSDRWSGNQGTKNGLESQNSYVLHLKWIKNGFIRVPVTFVGNQTYRITGGKGAEAWFRMEKNLHAGRIGVEREESFWQRSDRRKRWIPWRWISESSRNDWHRMHSQGLSRRIHPGCISKPWAPWSSSLSL